MNMMTTTALAGGVRVAVLLLLPLAAGFLAPVPASTRTNQQHLLLPAVPSSHAERRPCRCRHATAPTAEEALTAFNPRERQSGSRRQRVPVPRRTTTTTTAASGVSCRASREDVSSPATDSRPHDAGAGAGVGVGSATPSAVISAATASTADNEKEAEQEEQAGEGKGGSWSSTRLIPAATATAVPVVEVEGLGETAVRATGVSAAVVAADGGLAAMEGDYDAGLVGDVAPWTEFEDWLLQDTYSR